MKSTVEGFGGAVEPTGEGPVCSCENTGSPASFVSTDEQHSDSGCELVRTPRRDPVRNDRGDNVPDALPATYRIGWVWIISFVVWTFVALAGALTVWELYRWTDTPMRFMTTVWLQLSQTLTYAPLTPFIFVLAIRYPVRRDNWLRRSMLYLLAGLAFSAAHTSLRAVTPFAVWDQKHREWVSAIWDAHAHAFTFRWPALQRLFLYNLVDDISGTFVPILLIAHAISYYRKFQERSLRATQLESQLTKAHLQSLKSQLQPHFLFNTLHSISALMLTDVQAADRMITGLGDLLRLSLESAATQITTLSRELDFVNCYLQIEKARFEERLNLTLDIAPETLEAQVPLLLLQPLVDNAVKHGISRLAEGGEIHISSSLLDGYLQLEVKDNGPGIEQKESRRGSGLGLKVTRERLETMYGQSQSMELTSPPSGGLAVLICIPFRSLEVTEIR